MILFLTEKLRSPFLPRFMPSFSKGKTMRVTLMEKQNPSFFKKKLTTIYKIHLLTLGVGEVQIKEKLNVSLNLPVKFRKFSGKEMRKTGNEPGNWKQLDTVNPTMIAAVCCYG